MIVGELAQVYDDSLKKHAYRRNITLVPPSIGQEFSVLENYLEDNEIPAPYQDRMKLLSTNLPDISPGSEFRKIIPLCLLKSPVQCLNY